MTATSEPPSPENDLPPLDAQTRSIPGSANGRRLRLRADDTAALDQKIVADHPTDRRTVRRRVFDLAWPVIGENFLETLLGIVDTLLVGQIGAAAIAGVRNLFSTILPR